MKPTSVLLLVLLWLLTGCTYNSSPLHLNMRHAEFQREMAARFCLGMDQPRVVEALDSAGLDHRSMALALPEPAMDRAHIMAFLRKAGVSIDGAGRASGRIHFWFRDGSLATVSYQHPWSEASVELTDPIDIDLEDCDEWPAESSAESEARP
ncbi:MAG: hypothetical protein AAGF47_08285 [Planctomycetota bacterium]